jgi:glycerophosphoryl diester phosphodiesterase
MGYSKVKPIIWEPIEFKIYNARHTLVSAATVEKLTKKGLAINVWPVNEGKAMRRFIRAGAAGIITDFPQRLNRLMKIKPGE